MTEEEFKKMAQQLRKPEGEDGLKDGKTMNAGNLQMNVQSIKELNTTTNEHILEIGMGNGFFVKDILTPVESVKYTGCDFSQAMIDEASNINKEFINRGQAKFNLANAEELPFKNETFDKVLTDRKSTRLNSSHVKISYAVFCLKKKKRRAKSIRHDV